MFKPNGHGYTITDGLGDEISDDRGDGRQSYGQSYHQYHHHLGRGYGFDFNPGDSDGDGDGAGYKFDSEYVTILVIDENPMTMLYQTHCMQTTVRII